VLIKNPFVSLSASRSFFLSIFMFPRIYLSVHLSFFFSICVSVCKLFILSLYTPICPFFCLSVHISACILPTYSTVLILVWTLDIQLLKKCYSSRVTVMTEASHCTVNQFTAPPERLRAVHSVKQTELAAVTRVLCWSYSNSMGSNLGPLC
jgi:hypothetical protein